MHGSGSTIAWLLAGATILSNIVWVLTSGATRDLLTIAGVVLFFAASLTHALLTHGHRWTAAVFTITLAFGWAIEFVGTTTGLPFGSYDYTDRLGPTLGGVPVLIPLAWAMMTYPCLMAASLVTPARLGRILVAAGLLASWDLFLDPQMVAEGHWIWNPDSPALPGVPGIPISNYFGWILAALALMAMLSTIPAPRRLEVAELYQPLTLLAWVYFSSVLANAVFFDRPAVALIGGVLMGIPMAVVARAVWADTRATDSRPRALNHG